MKKKSNTIKKAKRKNRWDREERQEAVQDEQFYMIIGYTEWGFPYGITWEEYYANIMDYAGQEYYYISSIGADGEIEGLRWQEYLRAKDEELQELHGDGELR